MLACTKEEIRSVIRFLVAEGINGNEIYQRLKAVYHCIARSNVYEWVQKFQSGMTSVKDAPRPGQAHCVVTPVTVARAEELVKQDRRMALDEIAANLGISHGSTHHIVHEVLGFNKVCVRWIPRLLTKEMKSQRETSAISLMSRFEAEEHAFLSRIVTGDETWVHYHTPESKRASMEWQHKTSPHPKKCKIVTSAGKLMLTIFWDMNGVLVTHYQPRGVTVTRDTYSQLLRDELKPAIRTKRRGLLKKGVLLLHDDARPHTARRTIETITDLGFEVLPHPPYSPDLAPSDFHLFGPLKEALSGRKFHSDDEVQEAVHSWLKGRPKSFFASGIRALVGRWQKCIDKQGDYIEK